MKLRLDDNTRSALHFALLGGVVVLGARLLGYAISGVQHLLRSGPLETAVRPFQRGYLLVEPLVLVDETTDLPERLAFAFLLALLLAIATGALVGGLVRLLKRDADHAMDLGVRAGRVVLVLVTAWGMLASFFVPVRWTTVGEEGFVQMERPALFGRIALPGNASEQFRMDRATELLVQDGGLWAMNGVKQVRLARGGDGTDAGRVAMLVNARADNHGEKGSGAVGDDMH